MQIVYCFLPKKSIIRIIKKKAAHWEIFQHIHKIFTISPVLPPPERAPPCHCEKAKADVAIRTPNRVIARRPQADVGRKGAPPGAESSDRSGWAGTCLCTNEVQGKGLVPTRKSQGSIVQPQFSARRCLEIATGLTALAMTEEIGTQAQTIDHICHCEAPTGPWQSVPCAGSADKDQLPRVRIATSLRSSQ